MSKTILVADDSVTIQKVVELTFIEEDYEVVSVSSGDEALARVAELDPDLVITDVHMPGATGYQVCRAVKDRRAETPVLLLIGTFEPFDPEEAAACGADGHLKKPFDSQALLGLVSDLITDSEEDVAAPDLPVESAPEEFDFAPGLSELPGEPGKDLVDVGEAESESVEHPDSELAAAPTGEIEGQGEGMRLSDEAVDRIARRVVELMSAERLQEVAWEVVPDMAEAVIKDRLRDLENQVD